MAQIRLLPPDLANKIAAGEVVERPASVVKELVENALDSAATRIDIALEGAGKTLIRVTDNGLGIAQDDLRLALEAHATSKIATSEDLFRIQSHGFRGEALASIQSVARVRLASAQPGHDGWEVTSEGGDITDPAPSAVARGTTVEVRDLFFNVPARRRWMKSDSAEFTRVSEIVTSIAAANPEIGFSLRHGDRKTLDVPEAQSPSERVKALYRDRFKDGVLEVHDFEPYARVDAYIAPSSVNRPNSRGVTMFVNKRPIRDRSLLQSVLLAYREFIPHGRYPAAVIFIDVPPEEVDVNVHPAKTEVRLLQHNRVFSLIKAALTEKLVNAGALPAMALPTAPMPQARPDSPHEPPPEYTTPSALFTPNQIEHARDASHRWEQAREVLDRVAPIGASVSQYEVRLPSNQTVDAPTSDPTPTAIENAGPLLARARGLFQIAATYIVVEIDDGMVVIDQHAYHERILYWLLEHRVETAPVERQKLLVGLPLDLPNETLTLVDAYRDELHAFGFEIQLREGEAFLHSAPKYSVTRNHHEVVAEILAGLAEGRTPETPDALRKSLVEMTACKAAIKAGDVLSPEQIRDLLRLGETVPHTFSCPHGRPTTFRVTLADLEKTFHRR